LEKGIGCIIILLIEICLKFMKYDSIFMDVHNNLSARNKILGLYIRFKVRQQPEKNAEYAVVITLSTLYYLYCQYLKFFNYY